MYIGRVGMLVRRISRMISFNKRAESYVISAVILAGVAIALGLAVLAWAQGRSSAYTQEYSETMNLETAKLRERLAVEYVVYDESTHKVWIYLLNWGTIDDVEIQTIHIRSGTEHLATSNFILTFFNGAPIPDKDLDIGEEGCIVISSIDLDVNGYYYVRIVTVRGAVFDSTFVA
mgnify:CR=1 FL=1